ncbi:SPOR domain-containing protein [Deferribacter abyssi]|uniref:SPOR domain-containing protein n=1 Tax=Deferribacter abyssi TaxID=213806 RepID=UPI003C212389
MKDFEKIKEKKNKDDFKGVLFIGLIFVIAVGIIVFIIIQLTNQYIELKEKLTEENRTYEDTLTNPKESEKKIIISSKNNSVIDVEQIENNVKNTLSLKEELSEDNKNKTIVGKSINHTLKTNNSTKIIGDSKKTVKENKVKTEQSLKTAKTKNKKHVSIKIKHNKQVNNDKIVRKSNLNNKTYVVQLMAFKNKKVAENKLVKIRKILPDAFVMKIDLGSKGVWYRIRCCYSENYETAKTKVEKIKKQLKVNPIIVKTNQ